MSTMASRITGVSIVCSTICSVADQRKHQSSASLAFVRGIHRWPADSPHKGPVTRKMFPFDDVIIIICIFLPINSAREGSVTPAPNSLATKQPACGGRYLVDFIGALSSPGYPDGYSGNQNCTYVFYRSQSPPPVYLILHQLELHPNIFCEDAYVQVILLLLIFVVYIDVVLSETMSEMTMVVVVVVVVMEMEMMMVMMIMMIVMTTMVLLMLPLMKMTIMMMMVVVVWRWLWCCCCCWWWWW